MVDSEPILQAHDLAKSYPTAAGPLEVLQNLSLEVQTGEMVAVVGESGTGKSTLLHLLGALDRPTAGSVSFDGVNIFEKGDRELASFRNRSIGFVFQFHHLLPEFTALENVEMPALIAGDGINGARSRAMALLEGMGLADRRTHRPAELSGGEQQRVALARALMNRPRLVLMDEPTGNLDTPTAERLHDELRRLTDEDNQTLVVVTHNQSLADRAGRVLRLEGGGLVPAKTS